MAATSSSQNAIRDKIRPMTINKKKFAIGLLIAAMLIAVVWLVPVREFAADLIIEIRSYGALAPVIYFFIFLVAAVVGLSLAALTVAAGIIFEPVTAFLVVLLSFVTAFLTTFMLSRHLLKDWVSRRLEKWPMAEKCMSAVEAQGFRMLVLMRMNPFIPGFVNGYGFGMTSINFGTYFGASLVGSIPLMLVNLYLGWAGGRAILRGSSENTTMDTGMVLFGIAISVVTLIFFAWYGRRVLARSGV